MSARRQIIAALSEDSLGGIATLADVARAEQLVDGHRAEVLAEAADLLSSRGYELPSDLVRRLAKARAEEKATVPAAPATPQLTDRQTWLLTHIRTDGGHWKSGRVVNAYRLAYFGTVHVNDACADLTALRDAGHLIQHDETGVRYFTLTSQKGTA